MGMWKVPLKGFPPMWMDIASAFEEGTKELRFFFPTRKSAETFRFDWYAFKGKLQKEEDALPYDQKMFPTLPQIRAEIVDEADDKHYMKLLLRENSATAEIVKKALEEARKQMEGHKDSDEDGSTLV